MQQLNRGVLMECSPFILFTYNRSFILKGCVTFTFNHEHHTANATGRLRSAFPSFMSLYLSLCLLVNDQTRLKAALQVSALPAEL